MKSKLLKIIVLLILTGNIIKAEYFAIEDDFTRDSKNVYYFGEKVEGLSPEGFKILNNYVVKDKKNVFNIYTRRKIKNVDVNSFELVDNNYFKDKNNVYFQYEENFEKIESADSKTFEVIKDYFAKDRNNIYYFGKKLDNMKSDGFKIIKEFSDDYIIQNSKDTYLAIDISKRESFRNGKLELKNINNLKIDFTTLDDFIGGKFLKDKNSFYYLNNNNIIKIKTGINTEDFIILENKDENTSNFVKDKNNVYYFDKETGNIKKLKVKTDIETLMPVEKKVEYKYEDIYYVKDKNNVYYLDNKNKNIRKLESADNKTFGSMKNSFAKDKNNVYYRGRKMNFINPDKFQILDEYFAKDDKNLYQYFDFNPNIEIIKNPDIDINTFDIYKNKMATFYADKNNVYYHSDEGLKKWKGADPETLVIDLFSRDKNSVYYLTKKLNGVSPEGFEIIAYNLIKDNKNLYYIQENSENDDVKVIVLELKGIDLKTFEGVIKDYLVRNIYYKDKNNVYYSYIDSDESMIYLKKIDNADPKTFTLIENEIAGDKNNIYYKDQKIKGIDRKSFKKFDYDFIKDKNGIYNFENENDNIVIKPLKIEDLDLDSFDMIIYGPRRTVNDNINFYRDKKNIYYREDGVIKRINGANPELFEALDEKFSTDENNVYYKEKKLSGIDAGSFKTFEGNEGIFEDKNGLYIINDKNKKTDIIKIEIKNVDLKSFERFERFENYFRDKNNVYYVDDNGIKVLNGADVKTFERFQQEYTFYKDKNNIYYEDKKLEGVDRKTFESTSLFGKDKSNIYYKNKKLGLTSKNFQIISDMENIFKNAEGIYLINDEDVKETGAENIKIVPMESKNVDLKTFENLSTPIFSTNYYKDFPNYT